MIIAAIGAFILGWSLRGLAFALGRNQRYITKNQADIDRLVDKLRSR